MDARRPHMVVLRGVGVLLVLLLGSVLALVQPASSGKVGRRATSVWP